MRTIGRVAALVGAALVGLPALAGCAEPEYRFVGNDDHDLVIKVPGDWEHISYAEAARAVGNKKPKGPAWITYYDGDDKPAAAHAQAPRTDEPVLIAQSFDVPEEARDAITDNVLRDLYLPVTETVLAQQQAAMGATAGATPAPSPAAGGQFTVLQDKKVTTKTSRGLHTVFAVAVAGRTEVYDQMVLTDPDRSRVHLAVVHCSQQCFSDRAKELDQVVSSLTVKKN